MNTQKSVMTADDELRQALVAFERSVDSTPVRPVPAIPALIGLLRAVGDLTWFALGLVVGGDRRDPIHIEPRILRTA